MHIENQHFWKDLSKIYKNHCFGKNLSSTSWQTFIKLNIFFLSNLLKVLLNKLFLLVRNVSYQLFRKSIIFICYVPIHNHLIQAHTMSQESTDNFVMCPEVPCNVDFNQAHPIISDILVNKYKKEIGAIMAPKNKNFLFVKN